MLNIPLCKAKIDNDEIETVIEVLKSGWLTHGPKNRELEAHIKNYIGTDFALTLNSCTSALQLAVEALEIKGEILVPSFTFVATANAIILSGAKPVFVDIDKETRNICVNSLKEGLSDKTEAIMVVHYAGLPADMPKIIEIAKRHNLRIIEDSAQCLGGSYHGTKAGSYDIGCFSFFPTKNITTGEGGMLTTNDEKVYQRAKILSAHGIDSTGIEKEKEIRPWLRIASSYGYNFRMSNLLAAIGLEQMKKLEMFNKNRQTLAERYIENLAGEKNIALQAVPEGFVHSWQMFTIIVPQDVRDELVMFLRSKNIEASVHFDPPIHAQPIYENFIDNSNLHNTHQVSKSIITLPIFPDMSFGEVDFICEQIIHFEDLKNRSTY